MQFKSILSISRTNILTSFKPKFNLRHISSTQDMESVSESIRQKLCDALHPTEIKVVDDSWKHAGHASAKNLRSGETHFAVTVISSEFENVPLVRRHQMVYRLLKKELDEGVHALQLVTKTPKEIEKTESK